jgi:hypothetical protein
VDADQKTLALIDLATMRGIEIGALHNPRVRDNPNVRYLDHASRDELAAKYAENPHMRSEIDHLVEVDYVWRPGATLAATVGTDGPVDFVIASHVIEHIPDPISWLQQLADVVAVGGVVSLIIPDMRYTFDAARPLTPPAQLLDAHLRRLQVPSAQQIFDHEAGFLGDVDAGELWRGACDVSSMRRDDVEDPDRFAWQRCLDSAPSGEYVDVHCTTFTPCSFLDLLDVLDRLDLLAWELAGFFATEPGHLEFFATLRRVEPDADGRPARLATLAAERARTVAHEARHAPAVAAAPAAEALPPGVTTMAVSAKERRLLEAKRRIGNALRRRRPTPT